MGDTDDHVPAGSGEQAEPGPQIMKLTPVEARVVACLVEKEMTTPEYYPLTLKALTAACNQKSNRQPVMALEENDVRTALENLRYRHRLIWHVDEAGSRVSKYKHAMRERFNFEPRDLAVMCELMLRGPQTQGELRTRCSRLTPFASLAEVRTALQDLEAWGGKTFVTRLPAGPGRREARYAHLLCGREQPAASHAATPAPNPEPEPEQKDIPSASRLEQLEAEVSALRAELKQLRSELAGFREQSQ